MHVRMCAFVEKGISQYSPAKDIVKVIVAYHNHWPVNIPQNKAPKLSKKPRQQVARVTTHQLSHTQLSHTPYRSTLLG